MFCDESCLVVQHIVVPGRLVDLHPLAVLLPCDVLREHVPHILHKTQLKTFKCGSSLIGSVNFEPLQFSPEPIANIILANDQTKMLYSINNKPAVPSSATFL